MKSKTLLSFAIVLVTILMLSFQWQEESIKEVPTTTIPKTEADYFFKNVVMTSYDANGNQTNSVLAERIEHFKLKQLSIVQKPQLKAQNSAKSSWLVSSTSGRLDHKQQQLAFEKLVTIDGEIKIEADRLSHYSIQTQDLVFDLANNTARSKTNVLIKSQDTQTYANEFFADINADEIQLTGNVSTARTTANRTK